MAVTQPAAKSPGARSERVRNPYSAFPDWAYPAVVVTVFTAFIVYGVWVVFIQTQGRYGPYLSPFASPEIHVGRIPPMLWIFWAPAALRFTCYYYRKAYFRGYLWHPRSCAAPEPGRGTYRGEARFWLFNNLHRFSFYVITVQTAFLWYDVVTSVYYRGGLHFGLGVVIMLVNVVCLSAYTFGCHAFRHLAGGGLDCLSCHRARHRLWKGVTVLNVRHDRWAWISLASVTLTDLYIRLLINGVLPHAAWN